MAKAHRKSPNFYEAPHLLTTPSLSATCHAKPHLFKEVSVRLFGAHQSAIAAFSPNVYPNEPRQEGKRTLVRFNRTKRGTASYERLLDKLRNKNKAVSVSIPVWEDFWSYVTLSLCDTIILIIIFIIFIYLFYYHC